MKTIFLLLISVTLYAQVSINPLGVGIGQNTLSSLPLHIRGTSILSKLDGNESEIILSQHANPTSTLNSVGYRTSPEHNFFFNSFSGIYTFYTLNQEQGRIDDVNLRFTLQKEAIFLNSVIFNAPMRFNNDAGSSGKVLVSTGNSTPIWGNVTPKQPLGFGAYKNTTMSVAAGIETDFTTFIQEFDHDADLDFFPNTGSYVIPFNGVYHFDLLVPIIQFSPNTDNGKITLYVKKNGIIVDSMLRSFSGYPTNNQQLTSNQLSVTLKLVAGDVIKFGAIQTNNLNLSITLGATSAQYEMISLTGFKIY